MRLESDPNFAQWLLDIGHGRAEQPAEDSGSFVTLPDDIVCHTQESLIETIYARIDEHQDPPPPQF